MKPAELQNGIAMALRLDVGSHCGEHVAKLYCTLRTAQHKVETLTFKNNAAYGYPEAN
jgi:hypothetical protein